MHTDIMWSVMEAGLPWGLISGAWEDVDHDQCENEDMYGFLNTRPSLENNQLTNTALNNKLTCCIPLITHR